MTQSNRLAAEQAAFRSFANSYLREADAGIPVSHRHGATIADCVELALPAQHASLRIELQSRSLCGLHRFGRIWMRRNAETGWREIEPLSAVFLLIQSAYSQWNDTRSDTNRQNELELLQRVLQSYQSTKLYLEAEDGRESAGDSFIEAEQSLVFGHSLHPTPKSLQGMTGWQQAVYAPELGGSFQLVYFAARKAIVSGKSATARASHRLPTPCLVEIRTV
jgi:siderophore synthetase component